MIVDAQWPDNWRTDVDLWVQAPGDVPVGYSNKGGVIMNLLRDDLGTNDPTPLRYENQFSRGVPPENTRSTCTSSAISRAPSRSRWT